MATLEITTEQYPSPSPSPSFLQQACTDTKLTLTLRLALSRLSFIYKSPTILPKVEELLAFETSWNAIFYLVVAMSKDLKIAAKLNETDWTELKNVCYSNKLKESPLILPLVLEKALQIPEVEAIVKLYPQYELALLSSRDLAVSITDKLSLRDMTQENWKRLLTITRLEISLTRYKECQDNNAYAPSRKEICKEQHEEEAKCLKLVNTDLKEMRNLYYGAEPTNTESAILSLQMGFLLKLTLLSNRSSQFLEESLSMENIVPIYQAAIRTEMQDLKRKAEDFVLWEFEEISNEDKNFPSLKVDELFSLLMSAKINVQDEGSIFKAIVRWVMSDLTLRQKHVTILMKAVRLHLCSLRLLGIMLDHNLLIGLDSAQNSIREVIHLIQLNSPKLPELVKNERRRVPETLFVFGGSGTGQSGITVETFSTSKQQWIHHRGLTNGTVSSWTSAVAIGSTIYVFDQDRYSVSSFDPVQQEWKNVTTMPNHRIWFSVVALNDLIYVLGGTGASGASAICESLNPKDRLWTRIADLNTGAYVTGATTFQGKIYITGGLGASEFSSVEVLDSERNKWTSLAPLNGLRRNHILVSDGDFLWVFGGYNGTAANLDTVEKFDPKVGTWTIMPKMSSARYNLAGDYLFGQFFVIGGSDRSAVTTSVEIYNPRKKTWKGSANLNIQRQVFGACVVKDLSNALDYE